MTPFINFVHMAAKFLTRFIYMFVSKKRSSSAMSLCITKFDSTHYCDCLPSIRCTTSHEPQQWVQSRFVMSQHCMETNFKILWCHSIVWRQTLKSQETFRLSISSCGSGTLLIPKLHLSSAIQSQWFWEWYISRVMVSSTSWLAHVYILQQKLQWQLLWIW